MARKIKIVFENKEIHVDGIPDNAKITYAGLRPDQPGGKTNTLRIYRTSSSDNQLAVFRDVVSFVDCSLIVSEDIAVKKVWE